MLGETRIRKNGGEQRAQDARAGHQRASQDVGLVRKTLGCFRVYAPASLRLSFCPPVLL